MSTNREYPCELSPSGKCCFGGSKSFNYGFMWGSHSYCRHPMQRTPIFNPLSGDPIKCPLIKYPRKAESAKPAEASEAEQKGPGASQVDQEGKG